MGFSAIGIAGNGTVEQSRASVRENFRVTGSTYDKDNRLLTQGGTTFLYDNGTATPSASGAGPLAKTISGQGNNQTITTYTYEYWDDARQKTVQKTDPAGTGSIELTYNANGHLVREEDKVARLTTTFFNSANGLVLQREREQNQVAVGCHVFFYADGRRVGEIRNDPSDNAHRSLAEEQKLAGQVPPDNTQLFKTFRPVVTADFDQNFSPVNHGEPGAANGSYIVREGDTLQGVAQQVWGDSSLWYLIAEANGMAGTETLRAGQVLGIPNGVTTIHNNSRTLRPYNPAEVIGNVDPTIHHPPPPETRCGVLSAIIGAVVTAVVSFYSANPAAGAAAGDVARQYSSAALNDRLDWGDFFRESLKLNVLASLSPTAAGVYLWKHREHPPGFTGENTFDYRSTLISGLAGLASQGAGAVGQALGAPDYVRAGLQAGAAATTRQGLSFVMNRTEDFSWQSVMASAIGAAAGTKVTEFLGGAWGDVLGEGGARAGGNLAGGLLEQRLTPDKYRDYRGAFASTVGSIVGDAITQPEVFRPMLNADMRNFAETFAEQVAGQAQLPDPSLVDAVQYADASDVQDPSRLHLTLPYGDMSTEGLERLARALQRGPSSRNAAKAGGSDVGLVLSPEVAAAKQEFLRMEIEQINAAATQPSLFTIESATLAAAASQPLTPSMQAVGVAAESALRAAAEIPLAVTDLGQAGVGAVYTAVTGEVLDLEMRSGLGKAAQGGASTGEMLHSLNPAYGIMVGLYEVHRGLERGDALPLASFSGGLLGGALTGLATPSLPGYRPGVFSPGTVRAAQAVADVMPGLSRSGPVSPALQRGAVRVGNTGTVGVQRTVLSTSGAAEQAQIASSMVPGLTEAQAKVLFEGAFNPNKPVEVVLGGSRVRSYFGEGTFRPDSDLDIGFNSKMKNHQVDGILDAFDAQGPLQSERGIRIFSGNKPPSGRIDSPQEFFQRSGVRGPFPPERAGEPFGPSGFISFHPDGTITIVPPGGGL